MGLDVHLKPWNLDVHTIQVRVCGDQKRFKGRWKTSKGISRNSLPSHNSSLPTCTQCLSFLSMSSYFYYTWMDLWTIYRTVLHAFQLFYDVFFHVLSQVDFFTHTHTTYYFWTSSMSLWPLIVHCCIARPCVNMTHFIHFLLVHQVSYSPFAAVIKNTAISILKWASPCETSLGHCFPKYVSLTWRA